MNKNTRELFLYTTESQIYLVVSDVLITGEVNYYNLVSAANVHDLTHEWIDAEIKKCIALSSSEVQSNLGNDVLFKFGFTSFSDVYKKTSLITLRIEDEKIKIFNAKKVKRWYEFEPLEPTEGYGTDDDGVGKLSVHLVELLKSQ
jgi:hypothetical protein